LFILGQSAQETETAMMEEEKEEEEKEDDNHNNRVSFQKPHKSPHAFYTLELKHRPKILFCPHRK